MFKLGNEGKEHLKTATSAAITAIVILTIKEVWDWAFHSKPVEAPKPKAETKTA